MSKAIENKISDTAIRQELNRILQSPLFAQSDRLSRFLTYTVEHVLTGQDESLKEYVIGTEVYDRRPPYHPSQDSIVRTEARRLRSKLKEYYEFEGKEDSVFIFFRPGSYVPVFRVKDSDTSYEVVIDKARDELYADGTGVPIAVIPFLDISGQPLSGKYALGVTDELIHELMQSEGLRVVSGNSLASLSAEFADVASLARKLGVQVVFEGTVREESNRVRVTGRIVSADGFQLWSQRLDAEPDHSKVFAMQEQFATALVRRVQPQQSILLAAKATASPLLLSVYPTLLKGESLLEEGVIADVQAALGKFHEVAQITPSFARAYCGIARCHSWIALNGSPRSHEQVAQARAAADTALKLDPQMVDALTSVANVQALEWKWEMAESGFRKTAEHKLHVPGNRQFAMLLTLQGRFDEACLYLESAQRIDPFSYLQKAARARFFYLSRRYEEALEHFTEPLRYGSIPPDAQLHLAMVNAELGKYETARLIAQQAQYCTGAHLPTWSWIAEVYARCQDRSVAEAITTKFSLLSEDAEISKYRQARLAAALGNRDMAISLLSVSYSDREAELPYLAVEPGFDSIREMREFSDLAAKIRSANPAC
jgi:TolB-like protein/Tfp pilus assembly protein PilF